MTKREIDWTNLLFLVIAHVLAIVAVVYMVTVKFSWWTVGVSLLWLVCCGLGITGGYHRLFAHPTYRANKLVRAFYLLFGAASVQNSALKWCADHRDHHAQTDKEKDPYNIRRGFWWAHIGWVICKDPNPSTDRAIVKDLEADTLIRWQDRYYVPLAVLVGALIPGLLGFLWGDPIGALLVAGFLRVVLQWHATFSVNSFAHYIGTQPYSTRNSARDSFWTALITLGEGYHNFHHSFQSDYRNGVRWYHLDPTKWFVWSLSKIGMTWDLRRTSPQAIEQARHRVLAGR